MVEDNEGDVFLIREAVTSAKLDINLYFMAAGDTALRLFEQIEAASVRRPELLLDINIPKTNGFQVLSYLRSSKRRASMHVVVMTSSSARSDREKSESFNFDLYFNKPSTYDEFSDARRHHSKPSSSPWSSSSDFIRMRLCESVGKCSLDRSRGLLGYRRGAAGWAAPGCRAGVQL